MKIKFNIPSKDARQRVKRIHQRQWHQAFAWLPITVDNTNESFKVVWLEKYFRKKQNSISKAQWIKFSQNEYMRKKLNGDFSEIGEHNEAGEPQSSGESSWGVISSGHIPSGAPSNPPRTK